MVGETPIVDASTVTQTTRVTRDEFEKLPVGRSYQALMSAAPGVVGTGNANSAGALTTNNLFVIDAVDTTDPTTGTFGTNINFESIQEVSILTTAAGAEYGRAQGAIVNVVTKSGHQQVRGLVQVHLPERRVGRSEQDRERDYRRVAGADEVRQGQPGLLLRRRRSDHQEPRILLRHLGAAEEHLAAAADRRPDPGGLPADQRIKFANIRGTVQFGQGQTAWVKYHQSPTDGIVSNDYWGTTVTGDRAR